MLDTSGRSMSSTDGRVEPAYTDIPLDGGECLAAYPSNPALCTPDDWEDGTSETSPPTRNATNSTRRYGVADQHVEALQNNAFNELQVKRVRVIVPYNIMKYSDYIAGTAQPDPQLPADRLAAAKNTFVEFERFYKWVYEVPRSPQIEMMISFEAKQDGISDAHDKSEAPTEGEYVTYTKRFRNRFLKIKLFSAWNEPNNAAQPTRYGTKKRVGAGPRQAAIYANKLHEKVCQRSSTSSKDCRIVAAELLDLGRWREYMLEYKAALNFSPPYWALHPYTDVKRDKTLSKSLRSSSARYFAENMPAGKQLWFTEVGSHVDNGANTLLAQQAEVRFLLATLADVSGGIDRLYHYHMCEPKSDKIATASGLRDRHDTGLLSAPATRSTAVTRRGAQRTRRSGATRP